MPAKNEQPMPDMKTITTAAVVMGVLTLAPFAFGLVLCRNREKLNHPEVKDKIGALYFALDAKRKYVGTYSVIFLVRRSFFIAVTFLVYRMPQTQVDLMLYSTLGYICYISNMDFYETTSQRRIEIINECILIILCYHFVLFVNPVWPNEFRDKLGTSAIFFVSLLLGLNTLIIFWVNIIMIKSKCRIRKLKQ